MNRLNEITFNSSLLAEFRAIEFVGRLIDQGRLPHGTGPGEYRRINMHRIALDGDAKTLGADTKLNNDYDFFEMLRQNGRRAARRFLDEHFDDIGDAQHRRPARGGAGRAGVSRRLRDGAGRCAAASRLTSAASAGNQR